MDDDDEPAFPRSFGSASSGGFNASTRAFKADPRIDNYVRLRRENPTAEIEVAIHGGIDQLYYMELELARCGISADEFVSVFDANPEAISKFSLFFMEKIIEARELKKMGETHLARRGNPSSPQPRALSRKNGDCANWTWLNPRGERGTS